MDVFCQIPQTFGLDSFVITVDEKYASYSTFDQTLLNEVDGINVTKTKTREPLKWYSLFFLLAQKWRYSPRRVKN